MTQYQLNFVYSDGKQVNVNIEEDKVERFFEMINRGEMYWPDEEMRNGFWTNINHVRYIQAIKCGGAKDGNRQAASGESELCCEDECNTGREGIVEQERA